MCIDVDSNSRLKASSLHHVRSRNHCAANDDAQTASLRLQTAMEANPKQVLKFENTLWLQCLCVPRLCRQTTGHAKVSLLASLASALGFSSQYNMLADVYLSEFAVEIHAGYAVLQFTTRTSCTEFKSLAEDGDFNLSNVDLPEQARCDFLRMATIVVRFRNPSAYPEVIIVCVRATRKAWRALV